MGTGLLSKRRVPGRLLQSGPRQFFDWQELKLTYSFRPFPCGLFFGAGLPTHRMFVHICVCLTHTTLYRARKEPPSRTPTSMPALG